MSELATPTIYKRDLSKGCKHIRGESLGDSELLAFDCSPRKDDWRPAAVRFIDANYDVPARPCDFSGPVGSGIVLNEKARNLVEPYLDGYGELLPLKCDTGRYWALNVTRLVDALDLDASEIVWGDAENILMLKRPVFRPEGLEGVLLFKIPQMRRAGAIFFTDPLVHLIGRSGLTGLSFRRVWPHRPGDVHQWI